MSARVADYLGRDLKNAFLSGWIYHRPHPFFRLYLFGALCWINAHAFVEANAFFARAARAKSILDEATQALVSEVQWGRRATLWTTPVAEHGSLPVRLDPTGDTADQLRRLRAFWDQAILPRPEVRFETVDLRFRGQVVTREADPDAPTVPPDSTATPPASAEAPATGALSRDGFGGPCSLVGRAKGSEASYVSLICRDPGSADADLVFGCREGDA